MIGPVLAVLDVGYRAARAGVRLAAAMAVVGGLAVAVTWAAMVVPRARRQQAVRAVVQRGCRALLAAMGIAKTVNGSVPIGSALFVANHRSWLDIPLALSLSECTLIAKREVKSWPVIGQIAAALGVVFIDRDRPRDLLRVIPALEQTLRRGTSVLLFPEGTTTNGEEVLPFRSGLFEAAERAGAAVVPWSLTGSARREGVCDALCWYGTESLLANLPRVAMLTGAELHVQIGAPIRSGGGRKGTCASARSRVVLAVASTRPREPRRERRESLRVNRELRVGVNRGTAGWG